MPCLTVPPLLLHKTPSDFEEPISWLTSPLTQILLLFTMETTSFACPFLCYRGAGPAASYSSLLFPATTAVAQRTALASTASCCCRHHNYEEKRLLLLLLVLPLIAEGSVTCNVGECDLWRIKAFFAVAAGAGHKPQAAGRGPGPQVAGTLKAVRGCETPNPRETLNPERSGWV